MNDFSENEIRFFFSVFPITNFHYFLVSILGHFLKDKQAKQLGAVHSLIPLPHGKVSSFIHTLVMSSHVLSLLSLHVLCCVDSPHVHKHAG